jgi:hypothetical protein
MDFLIHTAYSVGVFLLAAVVLCLFAPLRRRRKHTHRNQTPTPQVANPLDHLRIDLTPKLAQRLHRLAAEARVRRRIVTFADLPEIGVLENNVIILSREFCIPNPYTLYDVRNVDWSAGTQERGGTRSASTPQQHNCADEREDSHHSGRGNPYPKSWAGDSVLKRNDKVSVQQVTEGQRCK